MSAHSILSASASERWSTCPISVTAAPSPSGEAAAEGTMLHGFSETVLQGGAFPAIGTTHTVEGFTFTFTEERQEAAQTYVDGLRAIPWVAPLNVEARVYYGRVLGTPHNFSFGTADAWGFSRMDDGRTALDVNDAKFGRNVVAPDAMQLKTYAAGVIESLFDTFPLPHSMPVILRIHQPRLSKKPSVYVTTVGAILREVGALSDAAQAAVRFKLGTATQEDIVRFPEIAGKHCKYCTRKPSCRGYLTQIDSMVASAGQPIVWAKASEHLKMFDTLEMYKDAIMAHAEREVQRGVVLPGVKVVEVADGKPATLLSDAVVDIMAAKYGIQNKVAKTEKVYLTPAKLRDAFKAAGAPDEVVRTIVSEPGTKRKVVEASAPGRPVAVTASPFTAAPRPE